jgi:hypothetical protein
VVCHEERVHGLAVTQVVRAAEALALESEALIEPDRRLVPGEHVQLELAHAGALGPRDRGVEKRCADASPTVGRRDHQAEIGDVLAGRVRIPGERQTPDDAVSVDRDVHRGVGMPPHGLEVATLVCDRPPRLGGQEPFAGLLTDGCRESYELRRIGRLGRSDRDHRTMTP